MSKLFRLSLTATVAAASAVAASYGWDVHYGLTYGLARSAGFTQEQSLRLAAACQSVDEDPDTWPAKKGLLGHVDDLHAEDADHERRIKYHAFIDQRFPGSAYIPGDNPEDHLMTVLRKGYVTPEIKARVKAIEERSLSLKTRCATLGNIGPWLHFFQDHYTHAGYGSKFGHYHPGDLLTRFPFGATTDSINFQPSQEIEVFLRAMGYIRPALRNQGMSQATLDELRAFLQSSSPVQATKTQIRLPLAEQVFGKLQAAEKSTVVIDWHGNSGRVLPPVGKALQAINSVPGLYIPGEQHSIFDFIVNPTHEIERVASKDDFVLWGDVKIKIPWVEPGSGAPKVTVAVDLDFPGEKPFVFFQGVAKSAPTGKSSHTLRDYHLTVKNVPVGRIIITARFEKGSDRLVEFSHDSATGEVELQEFLRMNLNDRELVIKPYDSHRRPYIYVGEAWTPAKYYPREIRRGVIGGREVQIEIPNGPKFPEVIRTAAGWKFSPEVKFFKVSSVSIGGKTVRHRILNSSGWISASLGSEFDSIPVGDVVVHFTDRRLKIGELKRRVYDIEGNFWSEEDHSKQKLTATVSKSVEVVFAEPEPLDMDFVPNKPLILPSRVLSSNGTLSGAFGSLKAKGDAGKEVIKDKIYAAYLTTDVVKGSEKVLRNVRMMEFGGLRWHFKDGVIRNDGTSFDVDAQAKLQLLAEDANSSQKQGRAYGNLESPIFGHLIFKGGLSGRIR